MTVWESIPSIGLETLNDLAALETRVDRKYVVPPHLMETIVEQLDVHVLEIEGLRRFEYETVYFDTAGLITYLAAARSRPMRFKVRTRTYLDTQQTMFEVKTRDRHGRTVKHRLPYRFEDRHRLIGDGLRFVEAVLGLDGDNPPLYSTLVNRYARRTILLPEAGNRATIDSGYRCTELDGGAGAALPDAVIVETKSTGRPGPLDQLLWRAGHRPERISKYCTGLAVARGGLPANKWHRTIVRHMARDAQTDLSYDSGTSQVRDLR